MAKVKKKNKNRYIGVEIHGLIFSVWLLHVVSWAWVKYCVGNLNNDL